ncbi:helix-turn-helix domain-containing protein [Rhodococcus erythropolis]
MLMGAAEKPIPEDTLPELRALATALRDAKIAAGGISYKELSRRTNYSTASLSQAASGKKLPTWDVTWAYARGCNCGEEQKNTWERLWTAARDEDRQNATRPRSATAAAASRGGRRQSVAELVQEELSRLQNQSEEPHINGMRASLALCITVEEFHFLLRKLMDDRELTAADVKEHAQRKGYTLRKFDIRAMISDNGDDIPDTERLHAFLAACDVDPAYIQDWHHTATRLKISQALRDEPALDNAGFLRRLFLWLRRSFRDLRFEALIGLICTVIVTLVQVFSIAYY